MNFYHEIDNLEKTPFSEFMTRFGEARQGVIPQPETPQEKTERLYESGHIVLPLEYKIKEEHEKYSEYDLGNKELPAYKNKREIIDTVGENRISLLTGPTGSGKSTQLAQYLLEAGYDRIVYLQPRRINVDNISDRIQHELTEQLGDKARGLVGIAHSERVTLNDDTPIQIMTAGTFTKKIPELSKLWANERVVVVPDEMHENNIEMEFASAYAVRQVEANENWRVVFASATPDKKIAKGTYEVVNGGDIPTIEIEGRPHELKMVEEPNMDIVNSYHEHNAGIAKSMIFVDGKRAIKDTISELRRSMSTEEVARTRFFKLHAKISERAKEEIFNMELSPGEKAIIVSTSAGQSGITIPGLGLVITSGLTKSPELDHEGAPGLPARLCTQAEIIQQGGRAGRDIGGGVCVLARPLGFDRTRNAKDELYDFVPLCDREPDMPPEIYSSNISRNVLAASAMGEDFFELNNYLKNSVSPGSIHEAYDVLNKLGAVDEHDQVTDIGRTMDIYPLRPELARAIAEVGVGKSLNLQVYTLAIAAAIEAGGLADFDNGGNNWQKSLRITTDDDFIAQLDMMLATRERYYGYGVDEVSLMKDDFDFKNVYRAHRQFDKMCRIIGLDPRDIEIPYPIADEEEELRNIFLTGMADLIYRKTATVKGAGKYKNVWGYDDAIEREISDRSLLKRMGQSAVGIVVGYPRWYVKANGEQKDILEMSFATSSDQIRRILGHLGSKNLQAVVRGGNLVRRGTLSLGSLSLGEVKLYNSPATSDKDLNSLVEVLVRSDTPAVLALRDLGESDDDIAKQAGELARGVHSVAELDGRLWGVVAKLQQDLG